MRPLTALLALPLSVLVLAGCSGPAPEPPAVPDAELEAPPPSWPIELGPCFHWHGLVDAPAADFPAEAPHQPVAGRLPGTVQVQAEGAYCGKDSIELWEGWPVADGGLLPRLVLTNNGTRAALYAAAGLPAENASLGGFYSLHGSAENLDGVGRADRSHALFVEVTTLLAGEKPAPAAFLLPDGGSVEWAAGGENLQGGTAWIGTSAFVDAGRWHGEGARQEKAAVHLTLSPA